MNSGLPNDPPNGASLSFGLHKGKTIKKIARDLKVSRNTVRCFPLVRTLGA